MIQDESEDDGIKWTKRKPCRPFEVLYKIERQLVDLDWRVTQSDMRIKKAHSTINDRSRK